MSFRTPTHMFHATLAVHGHIMINVHTSLLFVQPSAPPCLNKTNAAILELRCCHRPELGRTSGPSIETTLCNLGSRMSMISGLAGIPNLSPRRASISFFRPTNSMWSSSGSEIRSRRGSGGGDGSAASLDMLLSPCVETALTSSNHYSVAPRVGIISSAAVSMS